MKFTLCVLLIATSGLLIGGCTDNTDTPTPIRYLYIQSTATGEVLLESTIQGDFTTYKLGHSWEHRYYYQWRDENGITNEFIVHGKDIVTVQVLSQKKERGKRK